MKSRSPEVPTYEDHQEARRKYVTLAWDLWREQQAKGFFVWHPIPEEHLRIELALFWEGRISHIHGWTDILGQLWNAISGPVYAALKWLWDNLIKPGIDIVMAAVKVVINGILSVVNTIWAGLQTLGAKLADGVSWLYKQVAGFFSALGEVLKQIGTWIINAIKTYVVDPILALLRPVFEGLKSLISALFNFMTGGAVAGSPIVWRGSVTRWVGIISGIGVMAVSGLIGAELVNLVHPFKDTKAGEVAKFAMQFSGIAFLQAAFFGTYFDIACSKPVRQELNAMFTPEIPGSGDLIRFVVREVIVPDEFYLAMSLQGFSKYWSGAYWEAHWVLPPTERTRTAFLRKQIPEEAYRKFLIWYDFKPEPRPGIPISDVDIMLATQYDWPGRIDTRWMLEWGIINQKEAEELFLADGLDPKWAPRVTMAHLLNQLRDEYNRMRTLYMEMRREGFLKTEGFQTAIKALQFGPHVIEASIEWADLGAHWDEIKEQAAEWWRLAKAGKITPEAYGKEMRDLGMDEKRITSKQTLLRKLAEIRAAEEAAKAK